MSIASICIHSIKLVYSLINNDDLAITKDVVCHAGLDNCVNQ